MRLAMIPHDGDTGLDNPFWSSLRSRHRGLALEAGDVARYPPQFAPFLGVADAGVDAAAALATLVASGESVLLLSLLELVEGLLPLEASDDELLEESLDSLEVPDSLLAAPPRPGASRSGQLFCASPGAASSWLLCMSRTR